MPRGREFDVKALRQRLGLTQEEFAHQIGVTMAAVSRWERGKSKPIRLAIERMQQLEREAMQGGARAA